MSKPSPLFVRVAGLADVRAAGVVAVEVEGHALAVFAHGDRVHAVDNRCPHMGFPLHRGTLRDGILTCHWHHARFDLASGGTFDPWADDVRAFPVQLRDGAVWVDLAPHVDARAHQRQRLREGLERNLPLVLAKAVVSLMAEGEEPNLPFRIGLDFGGQHRQAGWGPGLTIHTCMTHLLPLLAPEDLPRALFHGLSAVANDCADQPPRFALRPLPSALTEVPTLKRWFRQFVEVRDADGAERCLVSAVRAGASPEQLADMLFAAATDHRYLTIGHVLDFTNKALEALDLAGWEQAEAVLTSLASAYANADRMEESNAWRHPVDLVAILERAFDEVPRALETGRSKQGRWTEREALVPLLLGEDPQAIADALLGALRAGGTPAELAGTVAYAAALRIARFHTSNEFGDWDTALHTFTFANAVHQGLCRSPSPELLRGVFDAAMSVYLDRFLNVPAAPLPAPIGGAKELDGVLEQLPLLLDRQQQVNEAGELVARYLFSDGNATQLLAVLGRLLLREDRNFHTIQMLEAAFRQHALQPEAPARVHVLVAATRYLAAHSPTVRGQGQTYQTAYRLYRGERLFEES